MVIGGFAHALAPPSESTTDLILVGHFRSNEWDCCNNRQGVAESAVRARSLRISRYLDDGNSRRQYRTSGSRAARAGVAWLTNVRERSWVGCPACRDDPSDGFDLEHHESMTPTSSSPISSWVSQAAQQE